MSQRSTIVVCEAYVALRNAMEWILRDQYQVLSVSSVRFIVEPSPFLKRLTPSLFIIDIDGQPALRRNFICLRESCKHAPILLLSNEFSLDEQLEARKQVVTVSFLQKPFSPHLLLDKVDILIRGYSRSPIKHRIMRIAQLGRYK